LLIRHADTFGYLKAQIIRRIGHIVGTNKERTVKRVTEWSPIAGLVGQGQGGTMMYERVWGKKL